MFWNARETSAKLRNRVEKVRHRAETTFERFTFAKRSDSHPALLVEVQTDAQALAHVPRVRGATAGTRRCERGRAVPNSRRTVGRKRRRATRRTRAGSARPRRLRGAHARGPRTR